MLRCSLFEFLRRLFHAFKIVRGQRRANRHMSFSIHTLMRPPSCPYLLRVFLLITHVQRNTTDAARFANGATHVAQVRIQMLEDRMKSRFARLRDTYRTSQQSPSRLLRVKTASSSRGTYGEIFYKFNCHFIQFCILYTALY